MQQSPLVSICIPTYNNAAHIAYTIDSLITQTYKNIEIIVCDDCSTDRTIEIVSQYNDQRISIHLNNKNTGITGNWNKSVSLASGEYVKLLCGDDLLYPQCIESQVSILESDTLKEISLVASVGCIINNSNKVIFNRKGAFPTGVVPSNKAIEKNFISGTNVIGEPMTGLYRKELLDMGLQYDGSNPYLIDLDFWFKLLQHGNLYYINETQTAFRISGKSLSANISFKQPIMFQQYIRKNKTKYNIPFLYLIIGYINSSIKGVLRNLFFLFVKN